MSYSAQFQSFADDKQSFFTTVSSTAAAKLRADSNQYDFTAVNRSLIEQEFNQLFTTLKNNEKRRYQFWLYCYYCSLMLESYYKAYGTLDKAAHYSEQAEKILQRCTTGQLPKDVNENSFTQALRKKMAADLGELVSTTGHSTKIRDWISFANITRLQLVFSRITVKQTLSVAQELKWIEKLDKLFGCHTDVDGMISRLNSTTSTFNFLSVGIFAARFLLNAGMVLKHTFLPSEEERALNMLDRFTMELNKSQCDFINDFVWFHINGLTNYSSYFGISASAAGTISAGFLFFDAVLLVYRRHLAEQDYLLKKSQYTHEKAALVFDLDQQNDPLQQKSIYEQIKVIDEQMAALELNWESTSATYWFNVAAALMLMSGFSAGLALSASAASASFFICTLAAAMYVSGDLYGKYYEKGLVLRQVQLENKNTTAALEDLAAARNDFITSMAKSSIMPIILVTTFAVSLPATLLLVCLYVGYEHGKGYLNVLPPPPLLTEDFGLSSSPSCF